MKNKDTTEPLAFTLLQSIGPKIEVKQRMDAGGNISFRQIKNEIIFSDTTLHALYLQLHAHFAPQESNQDEQIKMLRLMLESCEMQMRKVVHGLPYDMRKFEEVAANALKLVHE